MTLFGDLTKLYDKAQQLPMLPTLLVMKGAEKAGGFIKNHTFLGKTVKDRTTGEDKRIWRGSRYLQKHVLEKAIQGADTKSGGSIKSLCGHYESFHNWGKTLEQRNIALSSQNPSSKKVSAMADRFRNNTATAEDKKKLEDLNLRYDPISQTLVPKKPLSDEAVLGTENNKSNPNIENTHSVDTTPKAAAPAPKALPLSPVEKNLLAKMEGFGYDTKDTKAFLDKIRTGTLSDEDHLNLGQLNFKLLENKTLIDLTKDKMTPTEVEFYKLLDPRDKGSVKHLHEMKNEYIQEQFGYIRNGQMDKVDSRIKASLGNLSLSIQDGRILDPENRLGKLFKNE